MMCQSIVAASCPKEAFACEDEVRDVPSAITGCCLERLPWKRILCKPSFRYPIFSKDHSVSVKLVAELHIIGRLSRTSPCLRKPELRRASV